MTRTSGISIALLTLLFASVVPTSAGTSEEETYVFVGEDSEGNFIQRTVTQSELDGYAQCGGNAPGTITCINSHTTWLNPSHGFILNVGTPYSGYISSTLTDLSGNVRTLTCNVVLGTPSCAPGVGNWPVGPWDQRCLAHGNGDWQCWSTHQ